MGHKWVPRRRGSPFYGISAFTCNWKWVLSGVPRCTVTSSTIFFVTIVLLLSLAASLCAPAPSPTAVAPPSATASNLLHRAPPRAPAALWRFFLCVLVLFGVARAFIFAVEPLCALVLGMMSFCRGGGRARTAFCVCLFFILLSRAPCAAAMQDGGEGAGGIAAGAADALAAVAAVAGGAALTAPAAAPIAAPQNRGRFAPGWRQRRAAAAAASAPSPAAAPAAAPLPAPAAALLPAPPSSPQPRRLQKRALLLPHHPRQSLLDLLFKAALRRLFPR